MSLNKIVSRNIKYARMLSCITQEDLANQMNVNQSYVSAIENGSKPISINRLEKIAKILNVKPYIFLKENLEQELKDKLHKQ